MDTTRESRRQSEYSDMISARRPSTWSANEPPYTYTQLCPDPRRRERPVETHKKCLLCGRIYPFTHREAHCSCEGHGYLYSMSTYLQRQGAAHEEG